MRSFTRWYAATLVALAVIAGSKAEPATRPAASVAPTSHRVVATRLHSDDGTARAGSWIERRHSGVGSELPLASLGATAPEFTSVLATDSGWLASEPLERRAARPYDATGPPTNS